MKIILITTRNVAIFLTAQSKFSNNSNENKCNNNNNDGNNNDDNNNDYRLSKNNKNV